MFKLPNTRQLQAMLNQFGRSKGGLFGIGKGKVSHRVIDRGWDNFIEQLEFIEREKPFVKVGVQFNAGDHKRVVRRRKMSKRKSKSRKGRERRIGAEKDFMGPMYRPSYHVQVAVAQIALWNEFGTERKGKEHIPPRPFLRSTFDENTQKYHKIVERLMVLTFLGRQNVMSTLEILGTQMQKDVQRKIVTLRIPPNRPSTIKAKGSSNPLINSGQLLNSIRYQTGVGQTDEYGPEY